MLHFLKEGDFLAIGSEYFSDVIGNDALKLRLSKDVSENALSHAYILEGPQGSGRHKMALEVAAAIECEARKGLGESDLFGSVIPSSIPCGKCKNCEKILGGKSPDIITVGLEDDRATLGVESIRNLKNDMFTAPNDLSIKVFIIENADLMTEQAQNAFLLSLEEPPAYILFFLICENSANLLETVLSRAPTLRTQRIDSAQMADYLLKSDSRAAELKETSPEEWQALLSVSQGSIGYAIELLDAGKRSKIFEYRNAAKELIEKLSRKGSVNALSALSSFSKKRNDVIRQLSFLQYALRDLLLLIKAENAPLCFFEDRDDASELSTHFTAKGLFTIYDASLAAIDDLEAGANVSLTLMNFLVNAGSL
jgi:DNA polymerase-3 subunit delta'